MHKKILKNALLIIVLILSFYLRYKNYAQVPIPGQSMDEYSYSWVGLSLINLGTPIGISGIEGYKENDWRNINVDHVYQHTGNADPLAVNQPWFDHPPLLGLITGGYAYLKGARVFEDASIFLIRRPMLFLGTLSVFLVFLIAYQNFNYLTGIISAIIYGTTPFFVVGSRMVQGENGMVPLFLISLFLFSLYRKDGSKKWLIFSAITSGIATLFKLSGIVSVITIVSLLFISSKSKLKYQNIFLFLLISFSITSLFFIYGFAYDWTTFKNILFSNSNRFYGIGPAAIYNLITQTKITNIKFFNEPWVIALWVSFFILITKKIKKNGDVLLIVSVLSYLLTYLIFGSQPYGWYAIPFWPLLSLTFGRIFSLSYPNLKYSIPTIILLLIPIGYNLTHLINIENFQKYTFIWRSLNAIIILFLIILLSKSKNRKILFISRLLIFLLFSISIYLNIKYVSSINVDQWYRIN